MVIELIWADEDSTVIRPEPSRASCIEICVDKCFKVLTRLVVRMGWSAIFTGSDETEGNRFVRSIAPDIDSAEPPSPFVVDHRLSSLTGAAARDAPSRVRCSASCGNESVLFFSVAAGRCGAFASR